MEHFHLDWTFKPITMLHVNAPIERAKQHKKDMWSEVQFHQKYLLWTQKSNKYTQTHTSY